MQNQELTELEVYLVLKMKLLGVSIETTTLIMQTLLEEKEQREFRDYLESIQEQEIPERKLIITANEIAEHLPLSFR